MWDNWEINKIDNIVTNYIDFRGKTPLKLGMQWGGGDIRALSANNVEMGKVNFDKECYYGSDELYKKWMTKGDCEKGDVILTMEAPLGNVAQIPDDNKYILSQRTILLKFNKNIIDKNYIFHLLSGNKFQKELINNSTGSTVNGIQQKKLSKIQVCYPKSLTQQRKIARILSTCDQVIEQTEAAIAKYKALKQGMMHDLFTRGIDLETGKLRPKYEEVPELYKPSELGWIPKEWRVRKLEDITQYVDYRGKTPPKSNSGVFLITAKNIKFGYIDYEISKEYIPKSAYSNTMSRGIPTIGDVLITTEAPLGNVAQIDVEGYALAQRVIKYRCQKNIMMNNFLKQSLMADYFQRELDAESTGSTVKGIKGSRLHQLRVLTPDLGEQKMIINKISPLETKLQTEQATLSKYQQLKAGLMQDLLSGKVEVKEN